MDNKYIFYTIFNLEIPVSIEMQADFLEYIVKLF